MNVFTPPFTGTAPADFKNTHNRLSVVNPQVQRAQIEKLKHGFRICVSCQHANIEPTAETFCVRCSHCYRERMSAIYCQHCGSDLERSRVDHARMHGNECKQCLDCSKGFTKACEKCDVIHPAHWQCGGEDDPTSAAEML